MAFKTDIQIADEATMLPIEEVAAKIGFEKDDLNNNLGNLLEQALSEQGNEGLLEGEEE